MAALQRAGGLPPRETADLLVLDRSIDPVGGWFGSPGAARGQSGGIFGAVRGGADLLVLHRSIYRPGPPEVQNRFKLDPNQDSNKFETEPQVAPVMHEWTYEAMVHDLLPLAADGRTIRSFCLYIFFIIFVHFIFFCDIFFLTDSLRRAAPKPKRTQ